MTVERCLSPAEIAEALNVSRSTAYALTKQMERVRVGRSIRVRESVFERWREQNTGRPRPVAPPAPLEARLAAQVEKVASARADDGASTIRLTRPRS